jgi:hypothetical protein
VILKFQKNTKRGNIVSGSPYLIYGSREVDNIGVPKKILERSASPKMLFLISPIVNTPQSPYLALLARIEVNGTRERI